MTPGSCARLAVELDQGAWSVLRFGQMPGYTQDGWRQAASIFGSLHAIRYMFAVGPPRSEMTPVKPGVLSRIALDLAQDRGFRAALDDAALVLGDRAEACSRRSSRA